MIEILIRNIGRFVFLVLLQGIILNNVVLTDMGISPYFYILFILLLPFETPGWLILLISFLLGWSIDLFADTFGIHAASSLLLAFARPAILNLNAPRDDYESGTFPRIHYYGFGWFFRYTIVLVFVHHFMFCFLEIFSFQNIFFTLSKIAVNTILTTFLVILSQYLIFKD